jgi:hypothetical protein
MNPDRKTCSFALYPPQFPHRMAWDRNQDSAVGGNRLSHGTTPKYQIHRCTQKYDIWNSVVILCPCSKVILSRVYEWVRQVTIIAENDLLVTSCQSVGLPTLPSAFADRIPLCVAALLIPSCCLTKSLACIFDESMISCYLSRTTFSGTCTRISGSDGFFFLISFTTQGGF